MSCATAAEAAKATVTATAAVAAAARSACEQNVMICPRINERCRSALPAAINDDDDTAGLGPKNLARP